MQPNRSMPACVVIPELGYPDVEQAVEWLREAFDFTLRLRIPGHRAQLVRGDGAVVARERPACEGGSPPFDEAPFALMMRVDDVDRHFEQAMRGGAELLRPPADYPYGERQYSCRDIGGHVWTFSQSIADVLPAEWGGELFPTTATGYETKK